jgi:hypothetical protein
MKFIVDRSKWYRGGGTNSSALLRPDGSRCCIGFVGQQVGIPDTDLLNRLTIWDVWSFGKGIEVEWPEWMMNLDPHTVNIDAAYAVNDDSSLSESDRESKLKEIFLRNGDEIEFVDGDTK